MKTGMVAGGTGGAIAGTAVMPGVGTAGGFLLGAAGGGLLGSMFDDNSVATPGVTMDQQWVDANRVREGAARAGQTDMQSLLEARARGLGPSVAQEQLAQATQTNIAQQASAAASARGGAAAQSAAQRQAMMGGAQALQQQAGQGAELRAQEIGQATGQAAQGLAQMRSQDLAAQQGEMNFGTGISQMLLDAQKSKIAADTEQKKADTGLMGGLMSAGAGLLSDEHAKTQIHDGDAEVRAFLDALRARQYRYREGDPGVHTGVIAQDATRSEVGREIVDRRPDGYLGFDGQKSLGALLASVANLNERLAGLESRRG